jgi:hypothetical protein
MIDRPVLSKAAELKHLMVGIVPAIEKSVPHQIAMEPG